jgi:hypothetical protein
MTPLVRHLSIGLVAALLLAAVVTAFICAWSAGGRLRASVVLLVFLLGSYIVLVGQSLTTPLRHGQVAFPKPRYAQVFGNSSHTESDRYAVISHLHHLVPQPRRTGVPVLLWASQNWSETASIAAAQYGWLPNVLLGSPDLTSSDVDRIRVVRPDVVILLSDTGAEVLTALSNITTAFPGASLDRCETPRHGTILLHVCIIQTAR